MAMMKNEVDAPLLVTIGAIGGLLLLVSSIAVDAWYKSFEKDEVARKWEQSPNVWLADLRAAEQANLNASGPVDNGKRQVVPIAEAMKLLVASGGKLPTTQPAKP